MRLCKPIVVPKEQKPGELEDRRASGGGSPVPRCADCGATKDAAEFPRNRRQPSGRHCYCKTCHNARNRRFLKKVGGTRKYHLKERYGITLEEFDEMVARQGGLCAICREAPATDVDHDHTSGRARGILCEPCNGTIGLFHDDPAIIRRAIAYLIEHGTS